jgi:SHS2 domain-containing protein
MFEYLEQSSDIKIRVKERNEFNFFSDIVTSVNSAIFDFKPERCAKKKEFILEAKSYDILIHDFIDELVYFANQDHYHTNLININVEQKSNKYIMNCVLGTCKVKQENYKVEVKAVSFNVLYKQNEKTKERICEFVLDT